MASPGRPYIGSFPVLCCLGIEKRVGWPILCVCWVRPQYYKTNPKQQNRYSIEISGVQVLPHIMAADVSLALLPVPDPPLS